jgi:Flp pilus assembly protein TadG
MFALFKAITKPLRRFRRARRGSAAVEFALVMPPFFLLIFGLAEVGMMGFAQTSLNYAVAETARQIRTGQAQLDGVSESDIHDQLCSELNTFMMLTCEGNAYLDVSRFDSFTSAGDGVESPIEDGEFQGDGFGYAPGAASDIVVVRAYYRWKIMTPMFEPMFANAGNGERILVSTMMFRNEPFQ